MKLSWAVSMVVVAGGCRGGSPGVEPEAHERRGASPAPAPAAVEWRTPTLAWQAQGVDPMGFVAGAGAAVFSSDDGKGLLAVDLHTGRKRWELEVPDLLPISLVIAGDVAVFSLRTGEVSAVALADGSRRWSVKLGCTFQWPGAGEGLVAGSCDDLSVRPVRHGVAAVDLATGARRIRLELPDGLASSPAIDARAVYFARSKGEAGLVTAIDRTTGRVRWQASLPESVSSARAVGDVIVARGFNTFGLRASDGARLWKADTGNRSSFWIEREVVLHDGLVAQPRDGAVDGLDPKTGKVAATWTVPAAVAGDRRPMNGLWQAGDRLVAHIMNRGAPGHLVVWSGRAAQLLVTPPGVVSAIAGDTVLHTMGMGADLTTVRGLVLTGDAPADPVSTRAPRSSQPLECETDQYQAKRADSLVMMKDSISARTLLQHGKHFYWASRKGVVWRLPLGGGAAEEVGEIEGARLLAIDDEFFYRAECGTGGCGHHGDNQALIRVSRTNRARTVLADRLGIVHVAVLDRGNIYIGTWDDDHGARGSVARLPRKGGSLTTLWQGGAVEDLFIDGDRVFAVAGGEVISIPRAGGNPVVVVSGLQDARAVSVDSSHVYVAERGDPYWQSADSGYLVRVPRGGGKSERMLGPVRWPEGVAVLGDRVLVGLAKGDILSIPRSGGTPEVLVAETRSDPCRETFWMRAIGGSLYWLRAVRIEAGRGILWRLRP